jgi:hypothetical protein
MHKIESLRRNFWHSEQGVAMTTNAKKRCSYYDAIGGIGAMKGLPMIDVSRDDQLISLLMEMDHERALEVIKAYDREEHGYPTAEKVAKVAATLGKPISKRRFREKLPHSIPIYTLSIRLAGLVWGVITGLLTAGAAALLGNTSWFQDAGSWIGLLAVTLKEIARRWG